MKKGRLEQHVEIIDIGAKGKVVGKKDGQVYMMKGAVPGDVVTVSLRKKKKNHYEGVVHEIEHFSEKRVEPKCRHFEHCGGCNWQNFDYEHQLAQKGMRVVQQITRLAQVDGFETLPALGAPELYNYRNKLEFTFVDKRWLTPEEIKSEEIEKTPGLGFHVPGRFDWVLHVDECHLQDALHNEIRNFVYERSLALGLSFYAPRAQEGTMRNMVLRNTLSGDWMVLLIVKSKTKAVYDLANELAQRFPQIASLHLVHNQKLNDSYADCPVELIHGNEHIVESLTRPMSQGKVDYIIGPRSFFQTNTKQAERLYHLVYEWANIQPDELVYDLYTGTGSIALFVADKAKMVVGVEYVDAAIEDAKKNAELNDVDNTRFFAGDMKDVLTPSFISENGRPDVLITDPPRAGMHADVVERILEAAPERIVYVSCDPATQARDIALMKHQYELIKIQPVDMFPHTSHVENIALLQLKPQAQTEAINC